MDNPLAILALPDDYSAQRKSAVERRIQQLTEELAQQIHDEVLAYGLGLLVLMGPSASGARATLEPRFLQSLQRWLDMALVAVQGPAGTAAETAQADLFGAA